MEMTKDSKRRLLKRMYEEACNGYLEELQRMWELDKYYGAWGGDEVGGVYDYDGGFSITMDEIIYCVEHDVTQEQFWEWQDYVCDAADFGMEAPNLQSWMMGCPRTPPETFEHLRRLREQLDELINQEVERLENEEEKQQGRIVSLNAQTTNHPDD